MAKNRLNLESADHAVSTLPPVPRVVGIIVMKQDKSVWAECCKRMLCPVKDRTLRYFHVGPEGITAVLKSGEERRGEWKYPATQPL